MDGNRGAKGSIKDRLISMLYRIRYKKKKLKEENYTVYNKEKQVKYLNNLNDFKENEDINILDDLDKKELDNVEFNAHFKINNATNSNDNTISIRKPKGIGEEVTFNGYDKIDLDLSSIEYKSSELDTPVNIKKEIKKTKEEITILKEVDKFIKDSLENIDDIKKDVEELKKESKEKNKDTKELEEKYDKLKKKIEKLKLQYDTIKDKYDLSEFSIIESIKLIDSIDNYKSLASLNELDMMLNVCKKEIKKIDSITIINEDKKTIGSNIDEVKKEQKDVKIKFNKSKENVKTIKNIEETISNELKEQQKIVDDMYQKASYFEKQISKQIETIGHRKILSSLFRIAGGILTIPLTGKSLFGVALGSTMINKGLKEMNRSLEKREKIVINYKYEDISKQISEVKDKVEYINLVLSDSLNEIKKLKENFNNVFKNYDNILPEYSLMFESINALESKLLEQQYKLNKMDKKLDKEDEMNKQKLKKVRE